MFPHLCLAVLTNWFSEAVVHQGLIPRKVTVLMVSQDSYNGKWPHVEFDCIINRLIHTDNCHVSCFRIL